MRVKLIHSVVTAVVVTVFQLLLAHSGSPDVTEESNLLHHKVKDVKERVRKKQHSHPSSLIGWHCLWGPG